jgi:hypothetical protein
MSRGNKKAIQDLFFHKTMEYVKEALTRPAKSPNDSADSNEESAGAKWHVKQLQAAEEKFKELQEMQETIKRLVPPTLSTAICSRATSRGKPDSVASPPHEPEAAVKRSRGLPTTVRSMPEPLSARERPVSQWIKPPQAAEQLSKLAAVREQPGPGAAQSDTEYKVKLILKKVRAKVNAQLLVPIRNTKLTLDRETVRSISSHRFARCGPRRRPKLKPSHDTPIHLLSGTREQLQRTSSIYHSKISELPTLKHNRRALSRVSPLPQHSLVPHYRPLNPVVMDIQTHQKAFNAE